MRLEYRDILAKKNKLKEDIETLNKIKNQFNLSKDKIAHIDGLVKKKKFMFDCWNNMLREGVRNEENDKPKHTK